MEHIKEKPIQPAQIPNITPSPPSNGFLIAQLVKNPPAMQETPVRFLGQEDPLEKG